MKKPIYLYINGTLQRKDYSLVLIEKNGNQIYIPIEQIDIIFCFSEIQVNKRVLALLNEYNISLCFFNYYGTYIGSFTPKEHKNGKVILQHVTAYQDYTQRIYIAKQMIKGQLKNSLSLLKYYQKKGRPLSDNIEAINFFLDKVDTAIEIKELLIFEANAKQFYYGAFDKILSNDSFKFIKRSKNPPRNEINAMLSYGYSLLYALLLSILNRSSLLPQISFIHSLSKEYDSLQYDMADIFKPVLIDRLVLRLIRKKQINNTHFDYAKDGRCYLNKEGIKIYIQEFDAVLKSTIIVNGKSYSYKSLLSKEVHHLSNYIKGKTETYKPFVMKW